MSGEAGALRLKAILALASVLTICGRLPAAGANPDAAQDTARQILKETGISGGLIVHLGCGNGTLTAALRANDGCLVHGLETDAAQAEQARKHIQSLDLYGSVSVDRFDGKRLPYIDNSVNLVFDESTIYGFSRKPQYFRWTTPIERQLFASARQPEVVSMAEAKAAPPKEKPAAKGKEAKVEDPAKPAKKSSASSLLDPQITYQWTQQIPLHVWAMVLAGRTIFVAGPPDLVDEKKAVTNFADPAIQARLVEQNAALDGRKGALLLAVSTSGQNLGTYKLDAPPVFDGMAAAGGRLYLATVDGKLLCFAPP